MPGPKLRALLMSDAQIQYVISCLKLMDRSGGKVMALRPGVQLRFVDELQRRPVGTVWQSGGCRSWYQDSATGENPVIWPGSVVSYQWRTRSVAPADYELSGFRRVEPADLENLAVRQNQ